MEKKTLTSLVMVTFLMTSTAVVAMNMEEEKADTGAAVLALQLKETVASGLLSSSSDKNDWSFFRPFTWRIWSTPSVEERKSLTPAAATLPNQQEEDNPLTKFLTQSLVLKQGDGLFEQLLLVAASDEPGALEKAQEILDSASAPTVSSSAPAETLTVEEEGLLTKLWNKLKFWGIGSAVTTEVQAVVEEQK